MGSRRRVGRHGFKDIGTDMTWQKGPFSVPDDVGHFFVDGYGRLKAATDQGATALGRCVDDVGRNRADVQRRQSEADRRATQELVNLLAPRAQARATPSKAPASRVGPSTPPTPRPAPSAESVGLRGPMKPNSVLLEEAMHPLRWPLPGRYGLNPRNQAVEQGGGWFHAPRGTGGRLHQGIDIPAPVGTPFQAAADGRVVYAGPMQGYGPTIDVRDAYGATTRYAHLDEIGVKLGEQVLAGAPLGRTGRLGNTPESAQAHLHFEYLTDGKARDPFYFFDASAYPQTWEGYFPTAETGGGRRR